MRPSKKVLKAVTKGRLVIPIGKLGKFWRSFPVEENLRRSGFIGEWEIVAPNGKEWFVTLDASGRVTAYPE